ncbi:hypothetical protein K438DRAFT_1966628 [Mycena galopus ATCC 62051]|nr:hypothetical protein K438DRAFT_1966628 [Mycena galopus ATCC 62051]
MGNDDKMFYGDGRAGDWNPQDYLKKIKRLWLLRAGVSEADKVECFALLLASTGTAEKWFEGLDAAKTATWAALEAEFNRKWPKEVLVEKSAQEMSDEMMGLEMREDEMGKKIDVDGTLVYGHVRWTKQMRLICEKDTAGLLIPQVRRKLPQAMRNMVSSAYTDWSLFLKAIADVSVPDLLEQVEKEERLRKFDVALQSPTAPIRTAMAKVAINAAPSPYRIQSPGAPVVRRVPAAAANPFVSNAPIHPANLFAPGRTPGNYPPSTPSAQVPVGERFAIMQRNLPIHQPNTAPGLTAYTQQITTYNARHGEGALPNECRPYPLTPGTESLDSGACYTCAQRGHIAKDRDGNVTCPNPTAIPELERRWRNIAGFIYRMNRPAAAPAEIRYVGATQPFYDPNTDSYFTLEYESNGYAHSYGDEQGKGQGSSE